LRFWSIKSDGTAELIKDVVTKFTLWKPAFNRKGDQLAVGAWDRSIMLWDTYALQRAALDSSVRPLPTTNPISPQHEMSLMGHTQLAVAVAFDNAGRLLASASNDGTLRLWDMSEIAGASDPDESTAAMIDRRRGLATLDAKAGDAMCVAFLPSKPRIAASGPRLQLGQSAVAVGYSDGNVRLWDLQYFHESIIYNERYQRKLRGIESTPAPGAASPATAPSGR
jgi:WD40 repeat protein